MASEITHVREAVVPMNQTPQGSPAERAGQEGTVLESSKRKTLNQLNHNAYHILQ